MNGIFKESKKAPQDTFSGTLSTRLILNEQIRLNCINSEVCGAVSFYAQFKVGYWQMTGEQITVACE